MAILMGCAVLPHLRSLVEIVETGLVDDQQKVNFRFFFVYLCTLTDFVQFILFMSIQNLVLRLIRQLLFFQSFYFGLFHSFERSMTAGMLIAYKL